MGMFRLRNALGRGNPTSGSAIATRDLSDASAKVHLWLSVNLTG
jgi:hypothetical protein